MSIVTNTRDFYEVLTACHIPVIYDDGTARSLSNIVRDLFYRYKASSRATREKIAGALEYLWQDGYVFSQSQYTALAAILEKDQDDLEVFGNPELDGYFMSLHAEEVP